MAEAKELQPRYTVASLTGALRKTIEPAFSRIYVEAEISGWKVYSSGHAYFTLKDADAQIQAVMFAASLARCKARDGLKDGAKVLVYGDVTVYPPRGNYQLKVLAAKLMGEGDLMQRFLELKRKLADEGLFDSARKRPLPEMPRRIGIVTSESGAVIHDMGRVLTRRFPALEIRLFPAKVQGDGAAESLVEGLAYFNACADWRADLLIVARGGGSMEDLWCFNDERLVRAVAGSEIPVISAVGHETDYTLCDFAADRRAGTPSIAAEIAVPEMEKLTERIATLRARLANAPSAACRLAAERIARLNARLFEIPQARLDLLAQRVDHLAERLAVAPAGIVMRFESRLREAVAKLGLLDPYAVLKRGYSLTTAADGSVVKDAAELRPGDRVQTRLAKGAFESEIVSTEE